jgi:pantetheine-phosphate adenylyltransferase
MQFCDELIIAIGINPQKKTMFTDQERQIMITNTLWKELRESKIGKVTVDSFQGLTVEYARSRGATLFIRGIRSVSDFEYEINLANINKTLAPEIETVFLPTSPELSVVSSSMVKEIAKLGGDVSKFAPKHVVEAVKLQFGFIKEGKVHHHSPGMISVDVVPEKK